MAGTDGDCHTSAAFSRDDLTRVSTRACLVAEPVLGGLPSVSRSSRSASCSCRTCSSGTSWTGRDPSFLSPNAMALLVAADIEQGALTQATVNLDVYLQRKDADTRQPVYVLLKDGRYRRQQARAAVCGNAARDGCRSRWARRARSHDSDAVASADHHRAHPARQPARRDRCSASSSAGNRAEGRCTDVDRARRAAARHRSDSRCRIDLFARSPPSPGARVRGGSSRRRRPHGTGSRERRGRNRPRRARVQYDGIRAGGARPGRCALRIVYAGRWSPTCRTN